MRALAIDFGSRRIGVAVGESELGITTARRSIPASGTLALDAEAISKIAVSESADCVVVGLPYEPDGSAGKMVRICTMLAERIREKGCLVHTVDESLTSAEAESNLRETNLTARGRKKLMDGEAARLILERFFQSHV